MKWEKGQSGNPGGTPKGILRELREKHATDIPKIMDALVQIALDPEQKAKDRISASTVVLDRLLGKPQQKVDVSGDLSLGKRVDMSRLTDEQLRALAQLDAEADGDGNVH